MLTNVYIEDSLEFRRRIQAIYMPSDDDGINMRSKYTHVAYKMALHDLILVASEEAQDVATKYLLKDDRYYLVINDEESAEESIKIARREIKIQCLVLKGISARTIASLSYDGVLDFPEIHLYNADLTPLLNREYPINRFVVTERTRLLGVHGSAMNGLEINLQGQLDTLMSLPIHSTIIDVGDYRTRKDNIDISQQLNLRIVDMDIRSPVGITGWSWVRYVGSEWITIDNDARVNRRNIDLIEQSENPPHTINIIHSRRERHERVTKIPQITSLLEINGVIIWSLNRTGIRFQELINIEILNINYDHPRDLNVGSRIGLLKNLRVLRLVSIQRRNVNVHDELGKLPRLESLAIRIIPPSIFNRSIPLRSLILVDPPIGSIASLRKEFFRVPPIDLSVELTNPSRRYMDGLLESNIADSYPAILGSIGILR